MKYFNYSKKHRLEKSEILRLKLSLNSFSLETHISFYVLYIFVEHFISLAL